MENQTKKGKSVFTRLLLNFFAILGVALISEFIFILNNKPELIDKYYQLVKSVHLRKDYLEWAETFTPKNRLESIIYSKTTPKVLFDYLLSNQKTAESKSCKPLCLSYDESQKLLLLFEKTESDSGFSFLNHSQKSRLYFWMATISVWIPDKSEETSVYLDNATKLSAENEDAVNFQHALSKLENIKTDKEIQKYFISELEQTDNLEQYKKVYLADAAARLSDIYISSDPKLAENYSLKAIELNPWNESYYLSLHQKYLDSHNEASAKETLKKCISNLKGGAPNCESKL